MPKQKAQKDEGLEDETVFDETGDSDVGATSRHLAEEAEITDIEDNLGAQLKQCKEKLALCQKERQEYLDGWQRARADHLNYKQRLEGEREREIERQTAHFIGKLLPLCDSFDIALRDLAKDKGESQWHAGIKQIHNQLLGVLKSYNVEVLEPTGASFEPRFHEAVSEAPVTSQAQHHIILDVLQKGYRVGARLIRPAKVIVGSYKTNADVPAEESD